MNFKEVLNEGLVFFKDSRRIEKYIKSIQKKTRDLASPEIKEYIKKLILTARQFYKLEKEFKEDKINKEDLKIKYEALRIKNEDLLKELDKRTIRSGLIILGIAMAVLGVIKLIFLGISSNKEKTEDIKKSIEDIEKILINTKSETKNIPTSFPDSAMIPDKVKILEYIRNTAQKEKVDPELVKAIIQQESRFKPDAVGLNKRHGKIISKDEGIMQLNSSNYRNFKKYFNMDKDFDSLNYRDNILIGTRILKHLMKYYDGDLDKVIMAYNAGTPRVDKGEIPASTYEYLKSVKKYLNSES